jgi:A/G-specific adenine glycosylase
LPQRLTAHPPDRFPEWSLFRRRLLRWFRRERRDLPWRRTRDPYRIWVSETMLQQTQVARVLLYYRSFLRRFPTIRTLAVAPERAALAAWAGMGYYNRARNLHRAARIIVSRFSGVFPRRYEDVVSLPGIGRYTAGAILSIAFGKKYPALDGNTERVLARVLALRGNTKSSAHQKLLWATAGRLVPARAASDFNQGLMELGAAVCAPRQPLCGRCPVVSLCRAHRFHLETRIPQSRRGRAPRKIHRLVAVIYDSRKRVLLTKRRAENLMRDFWEFPQFDLPEGRTPTQKDGRHHAAQLARKLQGRFNATFTGLRPLCAFQHSVTFRRIAVHAFEAQMTKILSHPQLTDAPCRWVRLPHLRKYLFDSASLKTLSALEKS